MNLVHDPSRTSSQPTHLRDETPTRSREAPPCPPSALSPERRTVASSSSQSIKCEIATKFSTFLSIPRLPMSRVLLSYPNPPPFLLLFPRAAKPPAALTSGNPSRPNGGGSTMLTANPRRVPPVCKRSDDVDEMNGLDDVTFINGKPKIDLTQRLHELDLDDKYVPLIEYMSTFGLKESDFIFIFKRRRPYLPVDVTYAQKSLRFLLSVGVNQGDMKKVLKRQPQILSYTVEHNLKPHVAFLRSLGVRESHIGRIICTAPGLFSHSIELSLNPRVKYLIEEIGIKPSEVSKVIQFCPTILLHPIDNLWMELRSFLSKELGASRDSIATMVTKYPPILLFSTVEGGIKPRIDFLRSIEMRDSEILKVLINLPQVLLLSVERNLKPKFSYLVNELQHDVRSLAKYPKYFSLSLDQRIRPRHRFLVSVKKLPEGPFPIGSFLPADERFCQKWADTSLEKYLAFREILLLNISVENMKEGRSPLL